MNQEEFQNDLRHAKYMLAKHQFDKLYLYKYYKQTNKLPNQENLIKLKEKNQVYLKKYSNKIKEIHQQISVLYKKIYKQTLKNLDHYKNW
ncbi:Uncharacterised protein, partial [Metamycoplasma alkalescens]